MSGCMEPVRNPTHCMVGGGGGAEPGPLYGALLHSRGLYIFTLFVCP